MYTVSGRYCLHDVLNRCLRISVSFPRTSQSSFRSHPQRSWKISMTVSEVVGHWARRDAVHSSPRLRAPLWFRNSPQTSPKSNVTPEALHCSRTSPLLVQKSSTIVSQLLNVIPPLLHVHPTTSPQQSPEVAADDKKSSAADLKVLEWTASCRAKPEARRSH